MKLLIVENDTSIRTALARAMRSAGLHATFVSTASEGMAALSLCSVALIDLGLPDGSGTDLLRAIRLGVLPVRAAIFAGYVDAEAIVAASGERPDAMFRKPMDLNHLIAWGVGTS